jgi:hypothetical protein
MKILVLTSEPITADSLRTALGSSADDDTHVMVVAPALHESPLQFWLSDADEAISRAETVSRETLHNLDAGGVAATADTGDSDPAQAIEDALTTYPAERVIVFTHAADSDDERYREGVDRDELEAQLGVAVDHAVLHA